MGGSELAPLEAAIATLTAQAPDELFLTDTPSRQGRLEDELERQLAKLADNDDDSTDSYLDGHVFQADGDEIVVTDASPRGAGMASGVYQALKALRLPFGATVYYTSGEWEPSEIKAVATRAIDDQAAAAFGTIIALPTYFHAGGYLLELDRHLAACTPDSWLYEQLLDHEAEWMKQETLDEGEQRRAELQTAIDESRQEGDTNGAQLDQAQRALEATPPWFLLLTDSDLEPIAQSTPPPHHLTPPLSHNRLPWTKPTSEMFLHPSDDSNRQHIVAAYLLAR